MTEELLVRLLDKVENRYYGKYRAFVADNADPENRGRLKLRIPSVLGNDVVSGWALPCAPYGGAANQGFFFIPEADASVWAEFEAGNLDYPVWVGTFWTKPGGTTEVPDETQSDAATQRAIKTSSGILILLDDSEESLTIKDPTGNTIKISPDEFKITAEKNLIIDAGSNDIEIHGNNVVIKTDADVTMESQGNTSIKATGDANIEATGNTNVKGALVNLN